MHRLERVVSGAGQDLLNDDVAAHDLGTATTKDEQGHMQSIAKAKGTVEADVSLERRLEHDPSENVPISYAGGGLFIFFLPPPPPPPPPPPAFVAAAALGIAAVTLLVTGVAFAIARSWLGAVVAGGVLLVAAMVAGLFGRAKLPKTALGQTRRRLDSDVKEFKERVV